MHACSSKSPLAYSTGTVLYVAPPRAFFTRVDTVLGMDYFSPGLGVCNFVEDNISLTLVNYMPLGTDHFDSGLGVRNLTQTHLLKPSELTHKLPRDVVEASIPVLSCGITNGSTCADQTQMVTEPWASGLCVLVSGVGTRAQAWQRMKPVLRWNAILMKSLQR